MVRVAVLFVCFAAPLQAQLIPVKTIPLAQGNQFQIFPSANLGMGSVTIALEDPIQDPFLNPATGSRLEGSRFFASPTVYSVSRGAGGGRSLPAALLARRANWYGGLALALQQVEPSRPPRPDGGFIAIDDVPPPSPDVRTAPLPPGVIPPSEDGAHGNQFAFGMIGRSIPSRNLSIGASVLWNGLHGVDGVELLYAGSRRIAQSGHSLDVRVGALKEWKGERGPRSLEAIAVHNRFATQHDVVYADAFWDPITLQFREEARFERNFDHTNTWGLQLNYRMPLGASGWRLGWLALGNRSAHPKIPNYELTNVPAFPNDPGRTAAYNFGVGVSRIENREGGGQSRFGMDVIFEPISSYTWADATVPIATAAGDTIAIGGKTVENRFRFSNAHVRVGFDEVLRLADSGNVASFQLGLIFHSIRYRLAQEDHVQLARRNVTSAWVEWTPTWGLSVRLPNIELRYQGRATKGAGRPGSQPFFGFGEVALASGTILAAPNVPMPMTEVSTVTHQISVSVPLR